VAPLAELSDYQASLRSSQPAIPDVPPMFRVRMQCRDVADETSLLTFLRRDGVFAYLIQGGIEAIAVESATADAPRELVSPVADWFSTSEAALNVWLS
jgi:hypothetical protein